MILFGKRKSKSDEYPCSSSWSFDELLSDMRAGGQKAQHCLMDFAKVKILPKLKRFYSGYNDFIIEDGFIEGLTKFILSSKYNEANFLDPKHFENTLLLTCKNKIIDLGRKDNKQPDTIENTPKEKNEDDFEHELITEALIEKYTKLFKKRLDDKELLIFELKCEKELTYNEIYELTRIPDSTANRIYQKVMAKKEAFKSEIRANGINY